MANNTKSAASRRALLRAGLGAAAAAAALRGANAQSPPKLAKNVVMYQDQPKDGHECSQCANFIAPNACKIVEGEISPHGWCGAFVPKQA